MLKLKDYKIDFFQVQIFRWWSYTIKTPDKRTLAPLFGGFADRRAAERAALQQIEIDMARASVSGDELKAKLEVRES